MGTQRFAAAMFRDFAMARADGSFRHLLARISRVDVLVVVDWVMAGLTETERRDFREICEERYQARSLTLTSQMPVASRSATRPWRMVSSTG